MLDRLLRRAVTGYLLAVATATLFIFALDNSAPTDAIAAPAKVSPSKITPTKTAVNEPLKLKVSPARRLDARYNTSIMSTSFWQTDDLICKLPVLTIPTNAEQAKASYEQAYLRVVMWPSDHNVINYRNFLIKMGLCDDMEDKCYVDGTVLKNYEETFGYFNNMHSDQKLNYSERREGMCKMIMSDNVVFEQTAPTQRTDPIDSCYTLYEDVDVYRNTETNEKTVYVYWKDRLRKTEGACGETQEQALFMIYYSKVRYENDEKTLRYWLDVNSFTNPSDPSYPACSAEELDFVRQALDTATSDWEEACDTCGLDYKRTDVDLSQPVVTPPGQYITFVVSSEVPTAGEVAKAFFPVDTYDGPGGRMQQTMELNPHYYCTTNGDNPGYIPIPVADDWTPDISLTGILRHEFGHTLGYGHEFMADIGTFQQTYGCTQDGDQDPLMAKFMDAIAPEPDRSSVMMYPCGRIERTMDVRPDTIEFELSETDKLSHQCFYLSEDPDESCQDLGVSDEEDATEVDGDEEDDTGDGPAEEAMDD